MTTPWRLRVEKDFGISNGDWSDVRYDEIDWRHWSDEEKRDLWATMNSDAHEVTLENGVEVRTVKALPTHPLIEDNPYLRWLATELSLGELEADVMTGSERPWPPSPLEEWKMARTEARHALETFASEQENATKGDKQISRQGHASSALEALDELDRLQHWIFSQCRTDEEREFVQEAIAIAAQCGFAAGRHTQASLLKPFEKLALTGQKQTRYLEEKRQKHKESKIEEVARRRKLISQLLREKNRKGRSRITWLQERLKAAGVGNVSKSTLYTDIKAIEKKDSNPC